MMSNSQEIIFVEAGEKIELFKRRLSSVPMTYQFFAESTSAKPLSGLIEIHSQQMLFLDQENVKSLESNNVVKASVWDTFMTVYVIAGCDMEIKVAKRKVKLLRGLLGWIAVLVLLAIVLILLN